MSVNLGALDIGIEVPGLSEAVSGLKQVDTAGERAAQGAALAQQALHNTGAESAALTALMKSLGAELRTVTGAIRDSADAMTALSRKTDDAGEKAPPAAAKLRGLAQAMQQMGRAGVTAPLDAMSRRISLFTVGLQGAGTRAASLARLGQMEAALQRQVASGNLTLAQRIRVEEQLRAIETARAAALARETAAQAAANATGALAAPAAAAAGGGMLRGMLGGLAGVVTFGAVAGGFRAIGRAQDEAEAAGRKLNATSKMTGVALADIQKIAGKLEEELYLSESASADLTAMMTKMTSRAGDTSRTGQDLINWLDLAAANGLSAADALQALQTTLIGQDEGLNRLGLSNPQQIYEKWAAAAGTTAAKMNDAQKATAILNEVAEASSKVQGEAAKALDTTAGKQQKLGTAATDAAKAYGAALDPMRRALLGAATATVEWAGNHANLVTAIGTGVAAGGSLYAVLQLVKAVQSLNAAMAVSSGTALPGMLGGLGRLAAWAKSPAGMAILALTATAGAVTWAVGKANEIEGPERTKADAAKATPAQLQSSIAQLTRKIDQMKALQKPEAAIAKQQQNLDILTAEMARRKDGLLPAMTITGSRPDAPDPAKVKKELNDLIGALGTLADARVLDASEQRIALEVERKAIAQRDALAAVTDKTRAQVIALAEAEERLAAIQSVTGRRTGAEIGGAVLAGRAPGRGDGFDALDPSKQGAAVKPRSTVAPLTKPFTPNAAQMSMIAAERKAQEQVKQLGDSVEQQFEQLAPSLAGILGDTLGAAFEGGIGNARDVMLSALGGLFKQMGSSLITSGMAMLQLLPALSNPFTSGPAMIAAGAVLVALGGTLGGIATGRGGSAGSGGGAASMPAWNDRTSTIALGGPSAVLPGGASGYGAAGGASAAAPASPVTNQVWLIGPNDPTAARQLQGMLDRHAGRRT